MSPPRPGSTGVFPPALVRGGSRISEGGGGDGNCISESVATGINPRAKPKARCRNYVIFFVRIMILRIFTTK